MHKLYSPENEFDLVFIKSLLEAESIPYFVHNDHFGSLRLGPKIDLLNAKTIFVNESNTDVAQEVIGYYLQNQQDVSQRKSAYSFVTKMRVIIETLIFFWFIPQGRRWKR